MRHQNPAMNTTLEEARQLKSFLEAAGFPVRAIECDPTPFGQRSATMVPEDNIPQDGEAYNLVYLFDGSGNRDYHSVVSVREIVTDRPDLRKLQTLFGIVWPNGAQSELDSRVMRNPDIQQAVNRELLKLMPEVEEKSIPERREPTTRRERARR